jgi:hypothetical protein
VLRGAAAFRISRPRLLVSSANKVWAIHETWAVGIGTRRAVELGHEVERVDRVVMRVEDKGLEARRGMQDEKVRGWTRRAARYATWSGHNTLGADSDSRTLERDTDRCARLGLRCVYSESEIQVSGTARGDRF